jgi:ABC-type branched-chain amino acid transport systems, ATPase component
MTVSERVVEKAVEVRVDRVTKYFGGLVAVDNVSMDIEPRKVTLIIGPNGSGKTTLLNIISGYYKPDKGRVFYRGADITGLHSAQD